MNEEKDSNVHLSSPSHPPVAEVREWAGTLSLLVAISENGVIGKDNTLPWHLPADLKYFKNLTWGMPVVMGRKTFESIGKPLPGRKNIVLTHNTAFTAAEITVVSNLQEALKASAAADVKEVFIIGGAQIFKEALPLAQRIYLTRIHQTFDGDVFFDPIKDEPQKWQLKKETAGTVDEKNKWPHSFQVWERQ